MASSPQLGPLQWRTALDQLMAWALPRSTPEIVEAGMAQWEALGPLEDRPASILRSPQLLAANLIVTPEGQGELIGLPAMARAGAVADVAANRTRLVSKAHRAPAGSQPTCGRFLALTIEQSDASAASMINTRGLFSVWDTPPWDLWFVYVEPDLEPIGRAYLVSWIPGSLVDHANQAVRVNPVRSLWWLDSYDDAFVSELRSNGLV